MHVFNTKYVGFKIITIIEKSVKVKSKFRTANDTLKHNIVILVLS